MCLVGLFSTRVCWRVEQKVAFYRFATSSDINVEIVLGEIKLEALDLQLSVKSPDIIFLSCVSCRKIPTIINGGRRETFWNLHICQ
jgi:hypothetical protein